MIVSTRSINDPIDKNANQYTILLSWAELIQHEMHLCLALKLQAAVVNLKLITVSGADMFLFASSALVHSYCGYIPPTSALVQAFGEHTENQCESR